jgi:LPS sulfotransferase NodH
VTLSAAKPDQRVRFLIVAAERTGTNLLRSLLDTHPDIAAGGELFNPRLVKNGIVDWPIELADRLADLNEMRRMAPVEFVERLFNLTYERGYRAVGFKLLYGHGRHIAAVIDHLVGDKGIRVIHLRRCNLLRRTLSIERARATGIWWVRSEETLPAVPRLRLDLMYCLSRFANTEANQARYADLFKEHSVLDLFYEDMETDLENTATRAIEFLGLKRATEIRIRSQKTGIAPLRDAIENYDDLKRQLQRWLAFFEE